MPEPSAPPSLASALADRYHLVRPLGEGGMATVYLAEDRRHDRKVAIKVLKPALAAVVGGARFLAEIRTTANLQHPHILPLFDSGEADGFLYYVMPYVEGETLRERLEREKELPVDEAATLAEKVAGALDYAHRQGVIHRDIKPENILLQEGEPLVADFGIALAVQHAGGGRLTETGLSLGTPAYMAPEQASGDREPDMRSDVYGVGCILYEMLAGRPPHVGNSAQQVLARVLTEEPPSLTRERRQVPPNVAAAVGTAIQRVPADRFGSARELAEALRDPGFRGLGGKWEAETGRRPKAGVMVLVAAVAVATGFLGGRALLGEPALEPAPTFRQVTNTGTVGCAAISPDGTEVAMIEGSHTEETSCGGSLVVRALPAGAPLVLVDSVSYGRDLGWSPDGSALILRGDLGAGGRGLWVVPMGAGSPRRIDVGRGFATFKTADSVVVFWGEVMEVRDPRSGAVLRGDTLARFFQFADWSEEAGAWVAAYYAPERAFGAAGVLGLMDEDLQLLDSLPGFPLGLAWAGPRRVMVQEAGPHELSKRSIRVVEVEGSRFDGEPRILRDELLASASSGSSSADGRRWVIALHHGLDQVVDVDFADPDGRPRVVSRSAGSWLTAPALSPDGRRVAFFRNDLLGPNPYVVDLQSGTETPLASREGRRHDRIRWAPDGGSLVLSGHAEAPLAVLDLGAGTEREIDGTGGCLLGSVAEGLVAVEGSCWSWGVRDRLRIVDPESGEVRELPAHPGRLVSVLVRPDRVWATVRLEPGGQSYLTSLDPDASEWADHGVFPGARVSYELLAVDDEGRLYWMEAAEATRILRVRPGSDEPELFRSYDFECVVGYADVTPDLSRFICNSTLSYPDAWLVEWASEGAG